MKVPDLVLEACRMLKEMSYEAWVVGGAVRDMIMDKAPHDWDLATNATPEEVKMVFRKFTVVPTGVKYGTMTVHMPAINNKYGGIEIEITTFRADSNYSDGRRPDEVTFSDNIADDLARRDFTMNAIAYDPLDNTWCDPYGGIEDIQSKIVKCVGDAEQRFTEDALRLMRACRFMSTLPGFSMYYDTIMALYTCAPMIKNVSIERIRDEVTKILMSDRPEVGLGYLLITGMLEIFLPEVAVLNDMEQNPMWHGYNVYRHTMGVVSSVPATILERWAALMHDTGKAVTQTTNETGIHFYEHEIKSIDITRDALTRLRMPSDFIHDVCLLVGNHMFEFDKARDKRKAIRKLIARVGPRLVTPLANLRVADRSQLAHGSRFPDYNGIPLHSMIGEVLSSDDPVKPADLKINGNDIMQACRITPGPMVGKITQYLFKRVLDDPTLNETKVLRDLAKEYYKGIK